MTKKRQSKAALANMKKKAKRLERMPGMLVRLGPTKWKAFSETSKMAYIIVLCASGIVRGCSASQNGARLCKHVLELDIRLNRLWHRSRKKIDIKRTATRCHACGSRNYIRNGNRTLAKTGEKRQRYLCMEKCGHSFSGRKGFWGRHYDALVIVKALSFAAGGMSPARVREKPCARRTSCTRAQSSGGDDYSRLLDSYARLLRVDVGFK